MTQLEAFYEEIAQQIHEFAEQGRDPDPLARRKSKCTDIGAMGISYFTNDLEPDRLWCRAVAGSADACLRLGLRYAQGDRLKDGSCGGVSKSYPRARMYVELAADADDNERAKEILRDLDKIMTPEQIAQAQRFAGVWRERNSKIH